MSGENESGYEITSYAYLSGEDKPDHVLSPVPDYDFTVELLWKLIGDLPPGGAVTIRRSNP